MSRKRRSQPYQIKGVEALFGDDTPLSAADEPQTLPISVIDLPSNQPRRYFDPNKLEQLTESVKKHGILEPLLVRPLLVGSGVISVSAPRADSTQAGSSGYQDSAESESEARYELVAGERRFRAATAAGLSDVPVVVRAFNDVEALEVSLMENLQREDLNPVEETEGILELLALSLDTSRDDVISLLNRVANAKKRDQDLTDNVIRQMEIVDKVFTTIGRISPESFRTNRIPLLNLPEDVLESLRRGELEYTKARSISKVKDEYSRQLLLTQAVQNQLSLNEIRSQVKQLSAQVSAQLSAHAPNRTFGLGLESDLGITSRQTSDSNLDDSNLDDSERLAQHYAKRGAQLKKQLGRVVRRLKDSDIWLDPAKQKQVEQLISKLESLMD